MSEALKRRGGIRKRTVQREADEDEPETLSLRYLHKSCSTVCAIAIAGKACLYAPPCAMNVGSKSKRGSISSSSVGVNKYAPLQLRN